MSSSYSLPPILVSQEEYDLILYNGKMIKNKIKCKTGTVSEGILNGDINKNIFESKENPFLNLNNAFAINGCYIDLEENSEHNIRILNLVNNEGDGQAVYPKIIINAGKNSNTTIFLLGDGCSISC